ncbi:phosphatase PAP2 family protein [Acidimangrovimonas pyrenivorans]|uniref:Phosphatase PAP2 family protein n=1 Tax=Acidimangrovimonas pyrenivorans TaxID=2030798 RepID=A0ABV7AG26_9RHOB
MPQRRPLLLCLAVLAVIVACIAWIDRPLARFMGAFALGHALFNNAAVRLPVMSTLAVAGVLAGAAFLIAGRRLPKWVEAAMLAGIAALLALWLTHDLLKPFFGRIVPIDYLKSGRYAFRWFSSNSGNDSFPSGHAARAAAILTVLWVYFPRGRWLYAGAMAVLTVGLMMGRWHFLSDVLAGGLVGVALGGGTMALWRKARERWAVARG